MKAIFLQVMLCYQRKSACFFSRWVILHVFLVSADFQFKKIFPDYHQSVKQKWVKIVGPELGPICLQRLSANVYRFWTDRLQTQIRLLLEEQSDQGLHCLLFQLHLFDEILPLCLNFR